MRRNPFCSLCFFSSDLYFFVVVSEERILESPFGFKFVSLLLLCLLFSLLYSCHMSQSDVMSGKEERERDRD